MKIITNIFALRKHSGFLRYFKNSTWMFLEQTCQIVAGIFIGIWLAKYLGPQKFGIYSYVIAYIFLFSSFAKLGLDQIIISEIIKNPEAEDIYLSTAFFLKIFGSIFAIILIILSLPTLETNKETTLYILIISTSLIFTSAGFVEFYFQAKVQAKFISIAKITQLLVSSIVKIHLISSNSPLIYFVIAALFDSILLASSLLFIFFHNRNSKHNFFKFNKKIAQSILSKSWPLILSGITATIYLRIDQIMIGKILGEYDVGIYAAATRLSESTYLIAVVITASIFPAIINSKQTSEELYLSRLKNIYLFMITIAIIISMLTLFFSEWLITSIYGESYRDASNILIIHIWTSVFVFMGLINSKWLITEGMQQTLAINAVFGMFTNILLNFIFIPISGLTGAAMARLISHFASDFFFILLIPRTKNKLMHAFGVWK